jgi:ribonuclease D
MNSKHVLNGGLYWREKPAAKKNMMPSMLLSENTVVGIAEKLPGTLKALSAIKGVVPHKARQYGPELIGLIRAYQQELLGPGTNK